MFQYFSLLAQSSKVRPAHEKEGWTILEDCSRGPGGMQIHLAWVVSLVSVTA